MFEEELNYDRPFIKRRPAHNLFFAVMLPSPAQEDISSLFEDFRQRYAVRKMQIPARRLHVSLFNVLAADSMPDRIVELARLVGSAIRFVEFDLVLNRALSFRSRQQDKPLVLAADADSARSVNRLVDQIKQISCILSGTQPSPKGSITPHVTLAWDRVTVPEQSIAPVTLPVREVVLIHSHVGKSRYNLLGRWQLVPFQ